MNTVAVPASRDGQASSRQLMARQPVGMAGNVVSSKYGNAVLRRIVNPFAQMGFGQCEGRRMVFSRLRSMGLSRQPGCQGGPLRRFLSKVLILGLQKPDAEACSRCRPNGDRSRALMIG